MRRALLVAAVTLAACRGDGAGGDAGPIEDGWRRGPALPEALSNTAVAGIASEGGCMIYAALGVDASLEASGVTNRAFRWRNVDTSWSELPEVPGPPRLGASAVSLRGDLYVLGGYSVEPAGEVSHASLQRFDLRTGRWSSLAPLPIAIADPVAVAWRDRYIVVVSGWSNTANVDAVQIFDLDAGSWSLATPFPGTPVSGHAGALSGDDLIVTGGAASTAGFPIVEQAFRGRLDAGDPTTIAWTAIDVPPGPPRYRAAAGTARDGRVVVTGGAAESHDAGGIGYASGQPSAPLGSTVVYDLDAEAWSELAITQPVATMDHRGLVGCGGFLATVGGLIAGPAATADLWLLEL